MHARRGMDLHQGILERQWNGLGSPAAEGDGPVHEAVRGPAGILSTAGHVKPRGKEGGPPPKAKHYLVTDRAQYREGKVKRTPGGE